MRSFDFLIRVVEVKLWCRVGCNFLVIFGIDVNVIWWDKVGYKFLWEIEFIIGEKLFVKKIFFMEMWDDVVLYDKIKVMFEYFEDVWYVIGVFW